MLDSALLTQLQQHFASLNSTITLALHASNHPKQDELRQMLKDLASTSDKLLVQEVESPADTVHVEILKDGKPTGIHFKAVPGGHEFTSLVLAILNADGKGRLPDPVLAARVAALRGPVELRTYVSLSCTNCPEVVQALNQMALVHGRLTHCTVDGELVPDEVKALGIQGVPAVFHGDRLVHVGKAGLGELLEILEKELGQEEVLQTQAPVVQEREPYDVLVLGAGPAGVSAGLYLARKGVRTAILGQKVGGQVNDTLGIENLIAVHATKGPALAATLRENILAHRLDLLENRRIEAVEDGQPWKSVRVHGGETFRARRIIVATGARWRELGVPGEKEHIGRGVAFCPHCDGPFFAGKHVAVVGGGNSGIEAAIDLAGICSKVTVLEFAPELKADSVLVKKLESLGNVQVHTNAKTLEVLGNGNSVHGLRWEDRVSTTVTDTVLDGVFVQIGLVPNSSMVKDLVETNRVGEIVVDSHNRSSCKGIYAAGDVCTVPFKQIVIAMGEGAKAALSAFEDRMREP